MRVSGEVQGVAFRWYAAREAARLGLAGWVRNDPDGSVRGHFEGGATDVATMLEWCRVGSPSAVVRQLEVDDVEPTGDADFRVEP